MLERTVKELTEKLQSVQRQRESVQQLPPVTSEISIRSRTLLYNNISNIRWDLQSEDIKGGTPRSFFRFYF